MKFIEKYLDLCKQQKLIRHDMKQKRDAITDEVASVNFVSNSSCVHKMDVLGIGMGCKFTQIEIAYCDTFCEDDYCSNKYCKMLRKNHAYIYSVKLLKDIKKAKLDLVKSALKLKNR